MGKRVLWRAAIVLAGSLVWLGGSLAQQGDDPEELEIEQLPRYVVEVLVFSHAAGTRSSSESFAVRSDPTGDPRLADVAPGAAEPAAPARVYGDRLPSQVGPGAASGAAAKPQPLEEEDPFRFELVEADNLTLKDIRDRLDRLSAYDVLFHGAWLQEGYPEERAKPFELAIIDSGAPIAGTLTLHRSRFLHVRVAIDYLPDGPGPAVTAGPGTGVRPSFYGEPLRYHISEARRLRSGELHYFDHPAFGALVQVIPEPEPDAELELFPPSDAEPPLESG